MLHLLKLQLPQHIQLSAAVSEVKGTRINEIGDAPLEPEMSFVERHGLVVAHSLSRNIDSKTIVQVMNPSPAPVTVYKNEKVGLSRPLADVCADVCAVVNDSGKNLERNRKDTEAKTEAKTEATEKAIQQLLSDVQDVAQQEKRQLKLLLEEFQDVSVGMTIWAAWNWSITKLTPEMLSWFGNLLEDFPSTKRKRYVIF